MGQEQGQQNPNAPCGHSSSVLWAILVAIVEFVLLANRVQARGSLLPVPLCDAPAEADGTCFVTPSPWPGAADGPGCVCIPPHPPAELSESSSLNVSPCSMLWAAPVPMCPPWSSLMAAEALCQRELFLQCLGSMDSGKCISNSLGVPSKALPVSLRCVNHTPWWLTP